MASDERIRRIGHETLIRRSEDIFCACGMAQADAHMLAESLVRADMRGVKSHGLVRLPGYAGQIRSGAVNPSSGAEIVRETQFSAVMDGHMGLGALVSCQAAQVTVRKARENGIAFVTVRNSSHNGAEGLWTQMMSQDRELISFCATNSAPVLAPVNGVSRGIGSNPFSVSIPAGRHPNLCLDIACGCMAQGKIWAYQRQNRPLPEGAWIGPDGEETTDPNRWAVEEYIMLPFGGHKGFGLSMVMEALTSALSGSDFQDQWGGGYGVQPVSHCFAAMRIDAFTDADAYRSRIDRYVDYVHALPVREGCPRPAYPGEHAARTEKESRALGVPEPEQVLREMARTARELGLPPEPYHALLDME